MQAVRPAGRQHHGEPPEVSRGGRRGVSALRAGCLLLLLTVAPAAFAVQFSQSTTQNPQGGWIREISGPLIGEKQLQVTRFVGSVEIITGVKSGGYTLRLYAREPQQKDAERRFATYHLGVERHNGVDMLQPVGGVDLSLRAELVVQIPSTTQVVHVDTLAGKIIIHGNLDRLEVRTHGGDIELDGAETLHAVTMGGSVTVNHLVGNSFIQTGGGDIRVDASSGDLEIASLGGNIWLKAIARANIQAGGGNIDIVRCVGPLRIRTAGGNINLGEMGGEVAAETGGGNIRVGVAHGVVQASTALGDIELWKLSQGAQAHTGMGRITAEFIGDRATLRNSELVTSAGNIVVYFAGDAPGNLMAVTGASPTKRIVSEFPELKIQKGAAAYGPRSIAAEGTIHGGGPMINVRTMMGQIELRQAR